MSIFGKNGQPAVILDIDGVINSYSNTKFYSHFMYKSMKVLANTVTEKDIAEYQKQHPEADAQEASYAVSKKGAGKYRDLLLELPKIKNLGGPNGLFKFAREYCGSDAAFIKYCNKLAEGLDYNLIHHDPSMKEFMARLSKYGDGKVVVRSDGLSEVAMAVWERVINDRPAEEIQQNIKNMRYMPNPEAQKSFSIDGDDHVQFSGIIENNMQLKTEAESWKAFAKKYDIDMSKSVLIDDSRKNCDVARKLGMTVVPISKLDSLLQRSSLGTMQYKSLGDVLGVRMSKTLEHLNISYGQKVDVRDLFRVLLKLPLKAKNLAHKKEAVKTSEPTQSL